MILYTPYHHSEIFTVPEDEYAKYHWVSYRGKMCLAEQQQDGSYRLMQLLSSDPQDYLDDQLNPGVFFRKW